MTNPDRIDPPEDADWLAGYRERAKLVTPVRTEATDDDAAWAESVTKWDEPLPKSTHRIANVRAAGVAVRVTLFVLGIIAALLAVVGVAYVWE